MNDGNAKLRELTDDIFQIVKTHVVGSDLASLHEMEKLLRLAWLAGWIRGYGAAIEPAPTELS